MEQGYSFVGDNTPETLFFYGIIWNIIKATNPRHSFAMESIKTCHFKTFQVGILLWEPFVPFFFTIYMLKSLFCEDISVQYDYTSKKFKGGGSIDLKLNNLDLQSRAKIM